MLYALIPHSLIWQRTCIPCRYFCTMTTALEMIFPDRQVPVPCPLVNLKAGIISCLSSTTHKKAEAVNNDMKAAPSFQQRYFTAETNVIKLWYSGLKQGHSYSFEEAIFVAPRNGTHVGNINPCRNFEHKLTEAVHHVVKVKSKKYIQSFIILVDALLLSF